MIPTNNFFKGLIIGGVISAIMWILIIGAIVLAS